MMKNDAARAVPIIQWYPGHMKKTQRIIEENLKLVDIVIELLDARIPASSANPMLAEIIQEKPRLIVLNKSDLADANMTKQWLAYFLGRGIKACSVDSVMGQGTKQLVKIAELVPRRIVS